VQVISFNRCSFVKLLSHNGFVGFLCVLTMRSGDIDSFVIKQNQINYMLIVKRQQLHILHFYNISADFTFYCFQQQTGCRGESSYCFVNDRRDSKRFVYSSGNS